MSYKFESTNGMVSYYTAKGSGALHNENGPAKIMPNGDISYWQNGVLHREDGPAVIEKGKLPQYYLKGVEQVHYFSIDEIKNYIDAPCYELLKGQNNWRFYNGQLLLFKMANGEANLFHINDGIISCPIECPSLSHELAHIVEMNDYDRLLVPDFGFSNNVITAKNPNLFFRALVREVKVRAIECHLRDMKIAYGIEQRSIDDRLFKINNFKDGMLSSTAVKEYKLLPFGRFKTEKDVKMYMLDLTKKTYANWSFDRIKKEFNKRLEFINNNI